MKNNVESNYELIKELIEKTSKLEKRIEDVRIDNEKFLIELGKKLNEKERLKTKKNTRDINLLQSKQWGK